MVGNDNFGITNYRWLVITPTMAKRLQYHRWQLNRTNTKIGTLENMKLDELTKSTEETTGISGFQGLLAEVHHKWPAAN